MKKVSVVKSGLFFVCALVMLSCVRQVSEIGRYTYPPDFQYIEKKQLSSAMWRLAFASANLNRALHTQTMADGAAAAKPSEYQAQILSHLSDMESAASSLGGAGLSTNHPMLNAHLPLFLEDIAAAKRAVNHATPNYVLAGQVASACRYCHGKPSP